MSTTSQPSQSGGSSIQQPRLRTRLRIPWTSRSQYLEFPFPSFPTFPFSPTNPTKPEPTPHTITAYPLSLARITAHITSSPSSSTSSTTTTLTITTTPIWWRKHLINTILNLSVALISFLIVRALMFIEAWLDSDAAEGVGREIEVVWRNFLKGFGKPFPWVGNGERSDGWMLLCLERLGSWIDYVRCVLLALYTERKT